MNGSTAAARVSWLPVRSQPVAVRCAWKEYRMLRGFWLGVAGLATLQMLAARWFLTGPARVDFLFASAWGAAALYAIGAAVTLFAVEREERTDAYLRLLPRHERAMFAGKVLAAVVTAFSLVAVLIVVGGLVAGGAWPSWASAHSITSTGATAVAEVLAWGVLASLLCPQPLLAAIIAIAAASLGVQLAMLSTGQAARGVSLDDFNAAVPMRLALVAVIAALDVRLGLSWLRPRRWRPSPNSGPEEEHGETVYVKPALRVEWDVAAGSAAMRRLPSSRRMFTRLAWQSWGEGWQAMLAVLPVGLFLMVADALLTSLATQYRVGRMPPMLSLLSIPALYGAMVFCADQRGRQYRFLTDHAARPTIVWLARQVTWLAPLVLVLIVLQVGASMTASRIEHGAIVDALGNSWGSFRDLIPFWSRHGSSYQAAIEFDHWRRSLTSGSALAWWATLAAYGSGQLCSMLISSNVLAGFAALVLSIVITAWSIVIGVWGLSVAWFVAPLGLAALVASWVRCRAWLLEQRGWRPWLGPAAVVAVCLGLLSATLGMVRVAQVSKNIPIVNAYIREPLETTLARWEGEEPAARAVARQYEIIAASWPPSLKQILESVGLARQYENIASSWPPPTEAAKDALAELAELSKSPRCHFSPPPPPPRTGRQRQSDLRESQPIWAKLADELSADAERQIAAGDLDTALERLVTIRRLMAHSMQYQSFATTPRWGVAHQQRLLLKWAEAPGQTSGHLLQAIDQLWECESLFPQANEAIVADYLEILAIVRGDRPPSFFNFDKSTAWYERLAFFMNELPWERRRAAEALARMTEFRLDYADAVANCMTASGQNVNVDNVGEKMKNALDTTIGEWQWNSAGLSSPAALGDFYALQWLKQKQELLEAARTSYLPAIELGQRGAMPIRMQDFLKQRAQRWGEMMRLSLIAYRLDHGKYPDALVNLVPDYSPHGLMTDPFTCGMFQYRPQGFDLPTALDEMQRVDEFIPAGTPLLWSVGANDAEPHEATVTEVRDENGSSQLHWGYRGVSVEAIPTVLSVKPLLVMRLIPTTYNNYFGATVFTLPKIEAP